LFSTADYLDLFNAAKGYSLTEADLPEGDRVVRRIAEKIGGDFEHGDPADYFLRHRDDVVPKLSATTFDRFEALNKLLNATLPPK
jgi:hypothetical protein